MIYPIGAIASIFGMLRRPVFCLCPSFSSPICIRLLNARPMKRAVKSGIGISVTNLRMKDRLDSLLPSKIMYWTVLIENKKKKIPIPKEISPDRSILKNCDYNLCRRYNCTNLRAVGFVIRESKMVERMNAMGEETRMMIFLSDIPLTIP